MTKTADQLADELEQFAVLASAQAREARRVARILRGPSRTRTRARKPRQIKAPTKPRVLRVVTGGPPPVKDGAVPAYVTQS